MLMQSRFDLPPGPLPLQMHASDATGYQLFKRGRFGADIIRFPPGGSVPEHTHSGSHMLFVLSGAGWLGYEDKVHPLESGVCYLVPGGVRHWIRARTELTLIAVGDEHRCADSPERLHVVAK